MARVVNYTLQAVTEDNFVQSVATQNADGSIYGYATFQILDANGDPRQVESTGKLLTTPQKALLTNIVRDLHVDDFNAEQNL